MARVTTQVAAAVATMMFSSLITLLALEVVMRIFAPGWLVHRMETINAGENFGNDSDLTAEMIDGTFYRFKPGSEFNVNHYEYQNVAKIDEDGGRRTGRLGQNAKPIVPFMGDSFTFGVGVEDDETYVSLLEESTSELRFLNLGVPGSALPNQLDIIELRHEEFGSPELYVFSFYIGNDFANTRSWHKKKEKGLQKDDSSDPGSPPKRSLMGQVNHLVYHNPVLKRSYLVQFVRQKLLILIQRGDPRYMEPIFEIIRKDDVHLEEANKALTEELHRLVSLSEDLNFDFYFIVLPDRNQVNPETLATMAQYYGLTLSDLDVNLPNQVLAKSFAVLGISYVDITECLRESEDLEHLYYIQDNHFTAQGHRVAADCILPDLSSMMHLRKVSV